MSLPNTPRLFAQQAYHRVGRIRVVFIVIPGVIVTAETGTCVLLADTIQILGRHLYRHARAVTLENTH
jgi:hypothetical protein